MKKSWRRRFVEIGFDWFTKEQILLLKFHLTVINHNFDCFQVFTNIDSNMVKKLIVGLHKFNTKNNNKHQVEAGA